MEIYKELNTSASKEFEKLLNSQLSKTKIEEGKVIEGKIIHSVYFWLNNPENQEDVLAFEKAIKKLKLIRKKIIYTK